MIEFWNHPKFKPAAYAFLLVIVGILFEETAQLEPLARVGLVTGDATEGVIVADVPGPWGNLRVLHQPKIEPEPAPQPEPPDPAPEPAPPVVGPPIADPGLNVLIIEETDDRDELDRLNPGQLNVLKSPAVQEFVEQAGGHFRQLDQHARLRFTAKKWSDAMARPRTGLPWLIISNGTTGYEGPLPPSVDGATSLIQRYMGTN